MPHPSRLPAAALGAACAVLVACGGSVGGATPTPSPLSLAQIRTRYLAAADSYNRAQRQIAAAENTYCDPNSAHVLLAGCQTALSQDRQSAIAYDNALRAIPFTGNAATDASKLLSDDAAMESLQEQAATAPSIATVSTVAQQIFALSTATSGDATRLRGDLGLPVPT